MAVLMPVMARHVNADYKINGGPSVLFDAVAVLVSPEGAAEFSRESTAKDFISDAYAHLKFIAYNEAAMPLLAKAGLNKATMDEGVVRIEGSGTANEFLTDCRKLRLWSRAPKVSMAN